MAAFQLIVYCFDFHSPLRVQNANRYFVIGSVLALGVQLILLYPMFIAFGLVGPAISTLFSQITMSFYLVNRTSHVYEVSIRDLLPWGEVVKVFLAILIAMPILAVGKLFVENLLLRALLFVMPYLAAYGLALRILSVSEADTVIRALVRLMRWPRAVSS